MGNAAIGIEQQVRGAAPDIDDRELYESLPAPNSRCGPARVRSRARAGRWPSPARLRWNRCRFTPPARHTVRTADQHGTEDPRTGLHCRIEWLIDRSVEPACSTGVVGRLAHSSCRSVLTVTPKAKIPLVLLSAAWVLFACRHREPNDDAPPTEPVRVPVQVPSNPLSAGDELPSVSALAQTGARVTLERDRSRPLLLFFCESVRSRRCAAVAQTLSARWNQLRAMNAEVLGVARDHRALLRAVAYDSKWPFYVLADPQGCVFRAFGLKEGGNVYVVDAEGEIHKRIAGVPPTDLGERAIGSLARMVHESG